MMVRTAKRPASSAVSSPIPAATKRASRRREPLQHPTQFGHGVSYPRQLGNYDPTSLAGCDLLRCIHEPRPLERTVLPFALTNDSYETQAAPAGIQK